MALLENLEAYYKLDESSGNDRLDASGNGKTLTQQNGTVNSVAGKINNAAQPGTSWLKSSGFVSRSDMTIVCWVKPTSGGGVDTVAFKSNDFELSYNKTAQTFKIEIWQTATNHSAVSLNVSADQWHMIVAQYRSSQNDVRISVNAGAWVTTPASGSPKSNTNDLRLGWDGATSGPRWDRPLDEFGYWSSVLTDDDIDILYNSGAGVSHPFPQPPGVLKITGPPGVPAQVVSASQIKIQHLQPTQSPVPGVLKIEGLQPLAAQSSGVGLASVKSIPPAAVGGFGEESRIAIEAIPPLLSFGVDPGLVKIEQVAGHVPLVPELGLLKIVSIMPARVGPEPETIGLHSIGIKQGGIDVETVSGLGSIGTASIMAGTIDVNQVISGPE